MSKGFLHGTGGVTVKRVTGSMIVTNGYGSVNLGFKPDLVVFKADSYDEDGFMCHPVVAVPFFEDTRSPLEVAFNVGWPYWIDFTPTDTGFTCESWTVDESDELVQATGLINMNYIAVKYT